MQTLSGMIIHVNYDGNLASENVDVETPCITDGMAFVVADSVMAKASEWNKNKPQQTVSCEVRAALMGTYTAAAVLFNSGRRATSVNPYCKPMGFRGLLPDRNLVGRRRMTTPVLASPCQMEGTPTDYASAKEGQIDAPELSHGVLETSLCPVSSNHIITGSTMQVPASNRGTPCVKDSDWKSNLDEEALGTDTEISSPRQMGRTLSKEGDTKSAMDKELINSGGVQPEMEEMEESSLENSSVPYEISGQMNEQEPGWDAYSETIEVQQNEVDEYSGPKATQQQGMDNEIPCARTKPLISFSVEQPQVDEEQPQTEVVIKKRGGETKHQTGLFRSTLAAEKELQNEMEIEILAEIEPQSVVQSFSLNVDKKESDWEGFLPEDDIEEAVNKVHTAVDKVWENILLEKTMESPEHQIAGGFQEALKPVWDHLQQAKSRSSQRHQKINQELHDTSDTLLNSIMPLSMVPVSPLPISDLEGGASPSDEFPKTDVGAEQTLQMDHTFDLSNNEAYTDDEAASGMGFTISIPESSWVASCDSSPSKGSVDDGGEAYLPPESINRVQDIPPVSVQIHFVPTSIEIPPPEAIDEAFEGRDYSILNSSVYSDEGSTEGSSTGISITGCLNSEHVTHTSVALQIYPVAVIASSQLEVTALPKGNSHLEERDPLDNESLDDSPSNCIQLDHNQIWHEIENVNQTAGRDNHHNPLQNAVKLATASYDSSAPALPGGQVVPRTESSLVKALRVESPIETEHRVEDIFKTLEGELQVIKQKIFKSALQPDPTASFSPRRSRTSIDDLLEVVNASLSPRPVINREPRLTRSSLSSEWVAVNHTIYEANHESDKLMVGHLGYISEKSSAPAAAFTIPLTISTRLEARSSDSPNIDAKTPVISRCSTPLNGQRSTGGKRRSSKHPISLLQSLEMSGVMSPMERLALEVSGAVSPMEALALELGDPQVETSSIQPAALLGKDEKSAAGIFSPDQTPLKGGVGQLNGARINVSGYSGSHLNLSSCRSLVSLMDTVASCSNKKVEATETPSPQITLNEKGEAAEAFSPQITHSEVSSRVMSLAISEPSDLPQPKPSEPLSSPAVFPAEDMTSMTPESYHVSSMTGPCSATVAEALGVDIYTASGYTLLPLVEISPSDRYAHTVEAAGPQYPNQCLTTTCSPEMKDTGIVSTPAASSNSNKSDSTLSSEVSGRNIASSLSLLGNSKLPGIPVKINVNPMSVTKLLACTQAVQSIDCDNDNSVHRESRRLAASVMGQPHMERHTAKGINYDFSRAWDNTNSESVECETLVGGWNKTPVRDRSPASQIQELLGRSTNHISSASCSMPSRSLRNILAGMSSPKTTSISSPKIQSLTNGEDQHWQNSPVAPMASFLRTFSPIQYKINETKTNKELLEDSSSQLHPSAKRRLGGVLLENAVSMLHRSATPNSTLALAMDLRWQQG